MKQQEEARLNAQAALDAIAAEGARKQHEKWVVLGGLLQQGKRHLSYEEIRKLTGYNAERAAFHPGIRTHKHPTFEKRHSQVESLPDLPLRFAFVGTSGSGK